MVPAVVAGALVGVGEALWTWHACRTELGGLDVAWMAVHYAIILSLSGMVLVFAARAARAIADASMPSAMRSLRDGGRRLLGAKPDPPVTASWWSAVVVLPVLVAVMFWTTLAVPRRFYDANLVAAVIVAQNLGLVGVGAVLYAGTRRLVSAGLGRLPKDGAWRHATTPRTQVALVAVLVAAAIGFALLRAETLRHSLSFGWLGSLAGFTALFAVGCQRLPAWLARGAVVRVVAALVAAAFAGSAVTFADRQNPALATHEYSPVVRWILDGWYRVTDLDRDEHGSGFGAGDCAPFDDTANPDALEIPDDGIDQDCSGADLHASDVAVEVPAWSPPAERVPRPRNVVLLSIDAARFDAVQGRAADGRPFMPWAARFVQRAAWFSRTYTVAPRSVQAFASVFTGLYPAELRWEAEDNYPLAGPAAVHVTLAETLAHAGYDTAAFVSTGYLRHAPGFFQGFELVDGPPAEVVNGDGAQAVDHAIDWLRARTTSSRPYFLWVHVADAHAPYDKRPGFDFGDGAKERYLSELAFADAQMERLENTMVLQRQHIDTLFIFLADHGEAFGEHGKQFHGRNLYQEELRVPLAMRGRGIQTGEVTTPVSLVDVTPTVLDLLGMHPSQPFAGRTLVPALRGHPEQVPARALAAQRNGDVYGVERRVAIVEDGWKLIRNQRAGTRELYDLEADPQELRNAYDSDPDRAMVMEAAFERWRAAAALRLQAAADR